MYSDEIKRKFVNLKVNGFSFTKISNMLNVPRSTLLRWSREFQNEINQLKSDSLESFMNALKVSVKHRIKNISKEIQIIDNYIDGNRGNYYMYSVFGRMKIGLINSLRQFDNLLIPDISNSDDKNEKS